MLKSGKGKSSFVVVVLSCIGSLLLSAASLCGWLTDAQFAGQLWPSDVNHNIVKMLGGTVHQNAVGTSVVDLNASAVWLRLLIFTGAMFFVCGFRHRTLARQTRNSKLHAALRQSCFVSLGFPLWWVLWLIGDLTSSPLSRLCVGILPQWIMLLAAFYCWVWWQTIVPTTAEDNVASEGGLSQQTPSLWPLTFLATCIVVWVGISFWLNRCLYEQLLIPHGDSAMYEEHLWNIWHGKGFRSYLDQGLFLGEHIQVIHLLLLPVHLLWPSHLMLELTESAALGSCSIAIFLIARHHNCDRWAAAVLGVAWLFYFPMHFLDIAIDQKTFRPIALGLPFLFWMIYFAERQRFSATLICLLIALSAKEDMALITAPLLFVLALRGKTAVADRESTVDNAKVKPHTWLFGLSAFSVVYLVAAVLVIIPAFRSGEHVHYSRYFGDLGGSPGELVKTAFTSPLKVLRQAGSVQTVLYICVFTGPLAFFPLRQWQILAAGTLTFGMLSLLQFGGIESGGLPPVPYHHFHAPLLAIIFWAGIVAAGTAATSHLSAGRMTGVRGRAMLILFCSVGTAATGSMMPCGLGFWSHTSPFGYAKMYASVDPRQRKRAAMISQVVESIPLTARVASTDYVHTRLTHFERSYDYSGYLRKVNNYKPGVPADTDYIVIDTAHRYSEVKSAADVRELREEPGDWELQPDTTDGIFLVLKRVLID